MAPKPHVACLVDDSPPSALGARVGARHARRIGARLSIVHVAPSAEAFVGGTVPWSDDMADVDSQLRDQAETWLGALAKELEGEGVVLQGGHAGEIGCLWAEEVGCDLLVVAPQRGRMARIALGSVANYVATNAPCNVMVVRGHPAEDPPTS